MTATKSTTMNFFESMKTLIINPWKFFSKDIQKKKFWPTFWFFVLQVAVSIVPIFALYLFIFSPHVFAYTSVNPIAFLGVVAVILVIIILLSIIFSGISMLFTHLILKIVKGKGTLMDTYRVYVYSYIPSAVGAFFALLGGQIIGLYSFFLQIVGFAKVHKISYIRAAVPLIVKIVLTMFAIIGFFALFWVGLFYLDNSFEPYEPIDKSVEVEITVGETIDITLDDLGLTFQYTIELTSIENGEATFMVNGQDLQGNAGTVHTLADGSEFGIEDITEENMVFYIKK